MTKAMITAAMVVALGQSAAASTVNFSSSLFSDTKSTVTYSVDGIDLTFWAESAGTPERFFKNGGLSFGYSYMHALTIVASEAIQLTRLNGKTTKLDPNGASLPFSVLVREEVQADNLAFPAYQWGWLDLSEQDIIIPKNTTFAIDGDFQSWNWQSEAVLGAMQFEAYTPPPIPLPATAWLFLGALGVLGAMRGRGKSAGTV